MPTLKALLPLLDEIQIIAASNQVQRFLEKASVLEKHPAIGKQTPEIGDDKYREILCGRYRIIYKIESDNHVFILTVHHQSRLLKNNPAISPRLKRRK